MTDGKHVQTCASQCRSKRSRLLRNLPPLLGLLLLFGAIYVVQREFHNLRLADITAALRAIPNRALWLGAMWTVLSYGVLTFYDRLASIYAGHKVGYLRTSFASFCAYALSHNLGFAAVSGAAVRYRLYAHWGLTPFQIAKVVAFCSLTFGLGGMVLGGAILFYEPGAVPFFGQTLPHVVLYIAGAALWAIVGAYLTLSRVVGRIKLFGHTAELPDWRMAVLQVVLATVDVVVTAAIFYVLLPQAEGLTYLRFLAVYVASYTAGLAANLPGGIGVFDTAMLLGLSPMLEAPTILSAILVFRLYYYVIPLFLAGGMFAGNEALLSGATLFKKSDILENEPDFAVAAVTGTVGMCGALLLGLGIIDPRPDFSWAFMDWIGPHLAEMAAEAGQYVPSLIGTALMMLAVGLSQRVAMAWRATLAVLLGAALFTAAQGVKLWIPAVLLVSVLVVLPFRRAFYRHGRLLSGEIQLSTVLPTFALVGCVLALVGYEPHVRAFDKNSWWELVLSPFVPNGLRATVLLAVLLALAAAWRLMLPGRVSFVPWSGDGKRRYAAFEAEPPPRADGLVLGDQARAGVPFLRLGRVLLGLGDPAGAEADRISAIWRLNDLARQEGLDPAFWQTGPELLRIYGDLGLTALPLGPDGLPAVQTEETQASRYLCCVAERDLTNLLPLLQDLRKHAELA